MAWVLAAEQPSVRYLARRDLLRAQLGGGPFRHHGRAMDLGVAGRAARCRRVLESPAGDPRVAAADEHVLTWVANGLRNPPRLVDGPAAFAWQRPWQRARGRHASLQRVNGAPSQPC